jgi:hypothetical protein
MVTVRTDGGRSMARHRTRLAVAEAARYEVLLLLPGAADAQLCCGRTALPISYLVVSLIGWWKESRLIFGGTDRDDWG